MQCMFNVMECNVYSECNVLIHVIGFVMSCYVPIGDVCMYVCKDM